MKVSVLITILRCVDPEIDAQIIDDVLVLPGGMEIDINKGTYSGSAMLGVLMAAAIDANESE